MGISIFGKLSAFGALAIALLILTFSFEKAGSFNLASTAQTSFGLVMFMIVTGAALSMKKKFFK